jgi:Ras-related protein Rab-1A
VERQAHGFVIVFDLTSRESFENVNKWLLQLRLHSIMEDPPIVILGNKKDLDGQQKVTSEDI